MDSLKDKVYNKLLFIKNRILKNIFKIQFGSYKINLDKFELIKYDEFNKHDIEFWTPHYDIDSYKNITPECVKFTNTGLLLEQKNNKIGQISTINPLNYGIYELNIELPIGKNLNPKINLISYDSKLPKINILNAFTNNINEYINIYTNLYYGIFGLNNTEIGNNKTLKYSKQEIFYNYINIKFLFSDKRIEFYMNNYKIRRLTNKNILKYFKNKKFKLTIINSILNTSDNDINSNSIFRIKNFSYYKFK